MTVKVYVEHCVKVKSVKVYDCVKVKSVKVYVEHCVKVKSEGVCRTL